jgi:hypothetical protein
MGSQASGRSSEASTLGLWPSVLMVNSTGELDEAHRKSPRSRYENIDARKFFRTPNERRPPTNSNNPQGLKRVSTRFPISDFRFSIFDFRFSIFDFRFSENRTSWQTIFQSEKSAASQK